MKPLRKSHVLGGAPRAAREPLRELTRRRGVVQDVLARRELEAGLQERQVGAKQARALQGAARREQLAQFGRRGVLVHLRHERVAGPWTGDDRPDPQAATRHTASSDSSTANTPPKARSGATRGVGVR